MSHPKEKSAICARAEFISQHGELGLAVLEHFSGENLDYCETLLTDHYHGEWDSEIDFATQNADELFCGAFKDNPSLEWYFDYQLYARDLFIDDYFSIEVDGMTHVFSKY